MLYEEETQTQPRCWGRANAPRRSPSSVTCGDTLAGGACQWERKYHFVNCGLPFSTGSVYTPVASGQWAFIEPGGQGLPGAPFIISKLRNIPR